MLGAAVAAAVRAFSAAPAGDAIRTSARPVLRLVRG
jgi:hypothetical protein